jgi:hypothetical protein
MRAISLVGMPPPNASADDKINWCISALITIASASRQEGSALADAFTITPPAAPLRILNTQTATLSQVSAVLATFLRDMQARGPTSK